MGQLAATAIAVKQVAALRPSTVVILRIFMVPPHPPAPDGPLAEINSGVIKQKIVNY
jgi:hypothetical protein